MGSMVRRSRCVVSFIVRGVFRDCHQLQATKAKKKAAGRSLLTKYKGNRLLGILNRVSFIIMIQNR